MALKRVQVFDPNQPYTVVCRHLPHWLQAGTVVFITWRTEDSMPRRVIERWIAERNDLLRREGIHVDERGFVTTPSVGRFLRNRQSAVGAGGAGFGETGLHWKAALNGLPVQRRFAVQCALTEKWDAHLDECHGACLLRQPELAKIVSDSLRKFDGERYELTDFVVMPNHVHLLVAFRDEAAMLKQCANWKRFTARRINARIGREGEFWQEDAFDHLVRSLEQFEHYRRYIADNGRRANLPDGDYISYSRV